MLKKGFTVDVYCDKCRCQITNERKGLINYLIDPTFDHVLRFIFWLIKMKRTDHLF